MRTTAVWPPAAHDRASLVRGYGVVLGWPLMVGGQRVDSVAHAAQEIVRDEALSLHTVCSAFDALSVPRPAGTDALLRLDRRDMLVPSLITAEWVTLLVTAGTGARLGDLPGVEVASGSRALLALPPTVGVRWDTMPWSIASPAPLDLPDGMLVRAALVDGLRLYGQCVGYHGNPPRSAQRLAGSSAGVPSRGTSVQEARR
ncbi:hypothetical protein ACQPZG_32145 [Streptomyces sp. CA-294286]|uniref:hypothetical protein n=1 Tax=Streptomyces sp. CA-294286 TaxID=3240070 RepID=UPI003D947F31